MPLQTRRQKANNKRQKTTFGSGQKLGNGRRKKKKEPISHTQAIKKETQEKMKQTYVLELCEHEKFAIQNHLERLGKAREPSETRLLEKVRALKPKK